MIAGLRWAPAVLFGLGTVLVQGLGPQESLELRRPLDEVVPPTFPGYAGSRDLEVPEDEARVAGFDDYLLRSYRRSDGGPPATLYVGYYGSQTQGRTIHSPKNCLPGSGWEPLANRVTRVEASDGTVHEVNRYILQREGEQALVLYWYQGRGRVAHDEYRVKWDLLRDSALKHRSDEALVRIVVPVVSGEEVAFEQARSVAARVIPAVGRALPE